MPGLDTGLNFSYYVLFVRACAHVHAVYVCGVCVCIYVVCVWSVYVYVWCVNNLQELVLCFHHRVPGIQLRSSARPCSKLLYLMRHPNPDTSFDFHLCP